MAWSVAFLLLASAIGQTPSPAPISSPLVIVLSPTGVDREGLPVYTRHPRGSEYEAVLTRGFSGRLVRLYRREQEFLHRRGGTEIEPAYLLLSRNEGGFPRFGFWLGDVAKRNVGYVDLHERMPLSGRFGAIDQIFPHELMHVIVHQLAPIPPAGTGGANQVHAIGVRTDRTTAFNEGFAEHAQVLAIDDPDAVPATAALETGASAAEERLRRYRRALEARWSLAPSARLGFVFWFSQTEQVLRYYAVKGNAFAREPAGGPFRGDGDLYAAYLLENILPGAADGVPKPTPRLLATEGVVAALFSRWVTQPALQRPATDPNFYARFGTAQSAPEPIEHAYLKLFSVLADRGPTDTASVIRAYTETFPDERDAVADLVRSIGFAWPLPDAPEIWLANDQFLTGTTLFDQYRSMPRVHTFDLNAASLVDLSSVPGVRADLAIAIQRGAPYSTLADVEKLPGMPGAVVDRLRAMQSAMVAIRSANAKNDIESIDIARLFRPIFARAAGWMAVCAVVSGWLYGRVRRLRLLRLAINGIAAAFIGLVPPWFFGEAVQIGVRPVHPAMLTIVPLLMVGLAVGLWHLIRHRQPREAGRVMLAWTTTILPCLLITTPLF